MDLIHMSFESLSYENDETPDPRQLPGWVMEPSITFSKIPTDEILDLLWRGEHPLIPGFRATKVGADVRKDGVIKRARLSGDTQQYGEEYKTSVTVAMPGMLMRFINRYRQVAPEAGLQAETNLIPNSAFKRYLA